jgi:hypothetical protein
LWPVNELVQPPAKRPHEPTNVDAAFQLQSLEVLQVRKSGFETAARERGQFWVATQFEQADLVKNYDQEQPILFTTYQPAQLRIRRECYKKRWSLVAVNPDAAVKGRLGNGGQFPTGK